ncbi:hypothetical protein BH11MYX1_BH11MYX1_56990 [soil metagenome]
MGWLRVAFGTTATASPWLIRWSQILRWRSCPDNSRQLYEYDVVVPLALYGKIMISGLPWT